MINSKKLLKKARYECRRAVLKAWRKRFGEEGIENLDLSLWMALADAVDVEMLGVPVEYVNLDGFGYISFSSVEGGYRLLAKAIYENHEAETYKGYFAIESDGRIWMFKYEF